MYLPTIERRLALVRQQQFRQKSANLTPADIQRIQQERARVQAERQLNFISSSPGWMFLSSAFFCAGLAVLLQDYYMPHFQLHRDGSDPTPPRSIVEHIEGPAVLGVFAAAFGITAGLLAKNAPDDESRRTLHCRNAIAAAMGIIPGGLIGVILNLFNHQQSYNTSNAAAFCGGAVLLSLCFLAGCIANCSQDLPGHETHADYTQMVDEEAAVTPSR